MLETDGKSSAYNNLLAIDSCLNKYYNISLERSFKNYNIFLNNATGKKDTASLIAIVKYFENQQTTGQDLRNFAYYFRINGLTAQAYLYYQKAIRKIEEKELNTRAGHRVLVTCYRELALYFNENNLDKSWALLQKALNDEYVKYPEMKYDLGEFSVNHNYKIDEGLKYLLSFANDRKDMVDIINVSYKRINLLIAKAYFLQNNKIKGKEYAQLVLNEDPKNKEALALLAR